MYICVCTSTLHLCTVTVKLMTHVSFASGKVNPQSSEDPHEASPPSLSPYAPQISRERVVAGRTISRLSHPLNHLLVKKPLAMQTTQP